MDDPNRINPGHSATRGFFRVVGPIVFTIGLLFAIVGVVDFFQAFGSFGGPPKYFWCVFVGFPLVGVGGGMIRAGFMGAIMRYKMAEMAPVGKDTINYVSEGVKPAIKDVSQAIAQGISTLAKSQFCTQCGTGNDADAKFCKTCGKPIVT